MCSKHSLHYIHYTENICPHEMFFTHPPDMHFYINKIIHGIFIFVIGSRFKICNRYYDSTKDCFLGSFICAAEENLLQLVHPNLLTDQLSDVRSSRGAGKQIRRSRQCRPWSIQVPMARENESNQYLVFPIDWLRAIRHNGVSRKQGHRETNCTLKRQRDIRFSLEF